MRPRTISMHSNPRPNPIDPTLGKIAAAFVIGGVAGWVLENMMWSGRNSKLFGGRPIPFLPVYAFGTAAVVAAAPHLQQVPVLARGAIYAAGLSGVEYVACAADRSLGPPAWDYQGSCVDWPHAAIWGLLGLTVERVSNPPTEPSQPMNADPTRRVGTSGNVVPR